MRAWDRMNYHIIKGMAELIYVIHVPEIAFSLKCIIAINFRLTVDLLQYHVCKGIIFVFILFISIKNLLSLIKEEI